MPLFESAHELGEDRRQRMSARKELDYRTVGVAERREPFALERGVKRSRQERRGERVEGDNLLNAEREKLAAHARVGEGEGGREGGDQRDFCAELVDLADECIISIGENRNDRRIEHFTFEGFYRVLRRGGLVNGEKLPEIVADCTHRWKTICADEDEMNFLPVHTGPSPNRLLCVRVDFRRRSGTPVLFSAPGVR